MINLCFLLQAVPQLAKPEHPAADEFVKMDPTGIGLALISMMVVFSVLVFIYMSFRSISKFYMAQSARKIARNEKKDNKPVKHDNLTTEATAAIAMAIHLYYMQQHDKESMKLTIQKVSRMYSPWSSKIYTLTRLPR